VPVYTYTTIADPLATGPTEANGINDSGQIVGGYRNASGEHGFLLSGGAMIVTALRAAGVA
jgi:probable HAF family extracellular repeat protein